MDESNVVEVLFDRDGSKRVTKLVTEVGRAYPQFKLEHVLDSEKGVGMLAYDGTVLLFYRILQPIHAPLIFLDLKEETEKMYDGYGDDIPRLPDRIMAAAEKFNLPILGCDHNPANTFSVYMQLHGAVAEVIFIKPKVVMTDLAVRLKERLEKKRNLR